MHLNRSTHQRARVALALAGALLLGACAGNDPTTAEGEAPDALEVTLGTERATSFERVAVGGLPTDRAVSTVFTIEGDATFLRPVLVDDEGPFIVAPLHPAAPADGGDVVLRFEEAGQTLAELPLEILPPPATPGAYDDALDALDEALAVRVASLGLSTDDLDGDDPAALPPLARPLWIARAWLDLAREQVAALDDAERELLDRVVGGADLEGLFAQQAVEQPTVGVPDRPAAQGADARPAGTPLRPSATAFVGALQDGGCTDVSPDLNGVGELSAAMMSSARASVAVDPKRGTGRTLEALGWVLTGGGFVPGLGAVTGGLSLSLASYQATLSGIAAILPSSLDDLETELDRTDFDEDGTVDGSWGQVKLTASSTGWVADADVVNVLTSLVGAVAGSVPHGYGGDAAQDAYVVSQRLANSLGESVDLGLGTATTATGLALNDVVTNAPGGALNFCPRTWEVVVGEEGYVDAYALHERFAVDVERQTYRPEEVGRDVLRIDVLPARFGGRYVMLETPLEAHEIEVDVTPTVHEVEPGDIVQVTSDIAHAETPTREWDAGAGSWADRVGSETSGEGPRTRPLQTPADPEAYPFTVTITATSTTGLRRESPEPRYDEALIVLAQLIVEPELATLEPGETQQFTATDLEGQPVEVRWEADLGSIDSDGVYTAGEVVGEGLVTATSVDDPEIFGRTSVFIESTASACTYADPGMLQAALPVVWGDGTPDPMFGDSCVWIEVEEFCRNNLSINIFTDQQQAYVEQIYDANPDHHVRVPGARAMYDWEEPLMSGCQGVDGGPGPEPSRLRNLMLFTDGRWMNVRLSGPLGVDDTVGERMRRLAILIHEATQEE